MNSRLDSAELLNLAITASRQDQHEKAIGYLKQGLELAPDDAGIHYFLGAEHAQIGLYQKAAEELERALKLDPALHTARFQLGLLYLTSGRAAEAAQAWRGLDSLGPEHPLCLFKTGLLSLAGGDTDSCRRHLESGIERNTFSPALNQDMRRVLDTIASGMRGEVPSDTTAGEEKTGSRHVFVSAYTDPDKPH